MLRDHGINITGANLEMAHRELDFNGDKRISYDEFVAWKRNSAFESLSFDDDKLQQRLHIASTFDKFDRDRDGMIDKDEFRGLYDELNDLGIISCDMNSLYERIDKNNNGLVEFNELVFFMEHLSF